MALNFNIETGFTKKDDGFVVVEMKYKDSFTDDKYVLSGIVQEGSLEFNIERNNKNLKDISFNKEKDKFLKNLYESVNDYDFVEEFSKKHLESFYFQINEFIEKINKRPFSSNRKVIVIVDINRDRIDREILNIIDELKFPLINIEENKYVMPELVKVNNTIIKNLKELSEIARLNIENISLKTYKKQKINIGVNNRLVSIVKK